MINIKFEEQKPNHLGSTGVHLYSVNMIKSNNANTITIEPTSNAITLYKYYWDVAVFLSNNVQPSDINNSIETYAIFGNSKNKSLLNCKEENEGLKIVGYLNKEDVKQLDNFLNEHTLNKLEGVKKYYEGLYPKVKEELGILLDNDQIKIINSLMQEICKFIEECREENREIVLVYNA